MTDEETQALIDQCDALDPSLAAFALAYAKSSPRTHQMLELLAKVYRFRAQVRPELGPGLRDAAQLLESL